MSTTNRALVSMGLFTCGLIGLYLAGRSADGAHPWTRPVVLSVVGLSLGAMFAGLIVGRTVRRGQ